MFTLIAICVISMSISSLCSFAEACLLSISQSDIAALASHKPKAAAVWRKFKENIQEPIAVILIINTVAHTVGASLSGAQFEKLFGPAWIVGFSLFFSFAMIQWTEILPKSLGVKYNKKSAGALTVPLLVLIRLFTPIVKVIEFLNLPFVGKKTESGRYNPVQEIAVLSHSAFIDNLISEEQARIIKRTIGLSAKQAKDIMIPRSEMKVLYNGMTMMNALIEAHIHNHTRMPLVDSADPGKVLGYINFKDIVSSLRINPENPTLEGIVRPVLSFREEDSFDAVFKGLSRSQQHIAVIRNEQKQLTGLVTLEDLIEQIIGQVDDEYDVLPVTFYPITEHRYVVGGGIAIPEINKAFGIALAETGSTLHEWIIKHYGTEQKPGLEYRLEKINIILKKVSRSRIKEVIIEKTAPGNAQ